MEYKIISGRTVEIRRVMMDVRRMDGQARRRGTRVKGKTSLRKILANEREAVKNLARLINANFTQGDMWLTLTYPESALPGSPEEADKQFAAVLRKLRALCRKETGKNPVYITSPPCDADPKTGEARRLHFHVLMPAVAYEQIVKLWPAEDVTYRRLDGRGDYTGIAKYICSQSVHRPGKKRWRCSRGLKKPVYTEPVPVRAGERVYIPRNASLKEKADMVDAETGMSSVYVRYTRARGTRAVEDAGPYKAPPGS